MLEGQIVETIARLLIRGCLIVGTVVTISVWCVLVIAVFQAIARAFRSGK